MNEAIDYGKMAAALIDTPENRIDEELQKPEWDTFRSQIPARGSVSISEREAAMRQFAPYAQNIREHRERQQNKEAANAQHIQDYHADMATIARYREDYESYAKSGFKAPKPQRPALKVCKDYHLQEIDKEIEAPQYDASGLYNW